MLGCCLGTSSSRQQVHETIQLQEHMAGETGVRLKPGGWNNHVAQAYGR